MRVETLDQAFAAAVEKVREDTKAEHIYFIARDDEGKLVKQSHVGPPKPPFEVREHAFANVPVPLPVPFPPEAWRTGTGTGTCTGHVQGNGHGRGHGHERRTTQPPNEIASMLADRDGNVSRTAREAGIHLSTLQRMRRR